jgi:hypothetical protein
MLSKSQRSTDDCLSLSLSLSSLSFLCFLIENGKSREAPHALLLMKGALLLALCFDVWGLRRRRVSE